MKMLIPILAFATTFAHAQESVMVNMEYLPQSQYKMKYSGKNDMLMKISGTQKFQKELKKSGEKDTQNFLSNTEMEVVMQTFDKKDANLPFVYDYKSVKSKTEINGRILDSKNVLEGAKIYGHLVGNEINIDRFEGAEIDDAMKKSLAEMMKQTTSNITFPKNPLKIGDSFTQNLPLTIPIQGFGNLNCSIESRYTLRKIENNLANFDLDQKITMSADSQMVKNMSATGTGKGYIFYSMKNKIFTESKDDFTINLEMQMPENDMKFNATANSTTLYTLEKIK